MLEMGLTPEKASYKLMDIEPTLSLYRDAGQGNRRNDALKGSASYFLTILDCLRGIKKAIQCGILKLEELDVKEERVENGDMNWVVPGKFLALAGPEKSIYDRHSAIAMSRGLNPFHFADLIEYFKKTNVKCVVRLNNKLYDETMFLDNGIQHVDLTYPDGSNPPEHIMIRFLDVAEKTNAVHCKAGLGRTGTLIALYLMKHYQFTAKEVIGYLRVMRPGSVVGPQQQFLEQ
ncbi:phosphatases II [Rozella allomycis CSF55]|uniref:protein-tyrosine-phosphatase n=1 Tax=Rozella allomycis (strain CSF55) TaxID=988480 RepID=A0A4P9YFD6_ROZAC|nr:phosphatases II [Rozella allomycis CSF55]